VGSGSEQEQGNGNPAQRASGVPSEAELRKRFFFHKPRDEQAIAHHEIVSTITFTLAVELCRICPPGRNLSLALTALEDVRMRANASIACDDPRP
jgi:hypothetical protein